MTVYSMQLEGLEPSRANAHMNLNHARMPIPPQLLIKFSVVSWFFLCHSQRSFIIAQCQKIVNNFFEEFAKNL